MLNDRSEQIRTADESTHTAASNSFKGSVAEVAVKAHSLRILSVSMERGRAAGRLGPQTGAGRWTRTPADKQERRAPTRRRTSWSVTHVQ